ncbi:MAG: NosD domain-containing protein, partial [Promethearchaeota archaeon]
MSVVRHRRRGIEEAIIALLLVASITPPFINPPTNNQSITREPPLNYPVQNDEYIPHEPIAIGSDSDFELHGFPGNGTADDPFAIEYLHIDLALYSSEYPACISINHTRAKFIIRDCDLDFRTQGSGIMLENVSNAYIYHCEISLFDVGIELRNVSSCYLISNDISICEEGIEGIGIQNVTILRNELYLNYYGILVTRCTNTAITSNVIRDNYYRGIFPLEEGLNCVISNNTIFGHIFGQYPAAICLWNCPGWAIENNVISYNTVAFDSTVSNGYRLIRNNSILYNQYGFLGDSVIGDRFIGNHFLNCSTAISIWESEDCLFEGNLFENITHSGISFSNCYNCTLIDNEFRETGVGIYGDSPSSWYHHLIDNSVNDKPIGFYYRQSNLILEGNDFAQLIIASCDNITIQGGEFAGSSLAIMLAFSENCNIREADIHDESVGGIWLRYCNSILVERNSIYRNSNWLATYGGIILSFVANSVFSGNMIHNNIGDGIEVRSGSSVVNCTFTNNAIFDNHRFGLNIQGGHSNRIFGNAFGWNTAGNALDHGNDNDWDSEELQLGNWWHDYNETESVVYEIQGFGGSVDKYPQLLMAKPSKPPLDEIAMTDGIELLLLIVSTATLILLITFLYR